ncbi:PREDICTED: solute carrier organic anion transporter family member 3A1-like [Priapulus caudatus]|uniref:Solute carrier organic anion transporter family member n=1 Tax=Priapulus caudatus TaxID=37621 RepID=A0ABM1E537_PRICU|nr:PREDICTED: solute carrier organic anion transporter family member 3A1-like [Priapulus caudatus]
MRAPTAALRDAEATRAPSDDECGLVCRPRWARHLASLQLFMLTYSVVWLAHGGFYAYLVGSITTIERRFRFPSRQIGVLISINEFFHVALVVFASYFGGKGHKPRVLAAGVLVCSAGVLALSLPHYVYGADRRATTSADLNVTSLVGPPVCRRGWTGGDGGGDEDAVCRRESASNRNAYFIMAAGKALVGIGGSSLYALGTSYIDDNVSPQRSALYLGVVYSMRTFGPVLGMILSAVCAGIYVVPSDPPPDLTPWDPRWIGAYWLGFVILAAILAAVAIPMAMFPRRLPSNKKTAREDDDVTTALAGEREHTTADGDVIINVIVSKPKELLHSLLDLLRNPVYVCVALGACVDLHVVTGYFVWLPKFIETQFSQPAFSAAIVAALATLLPSCVGYIVGGLLINRLRLSCKGIILIVIVGNAIYGTLGGVVPMFLGCDDVPFAGHVGADGLDVTEPCNVDCRCDSATYMPVCGATGISFYSPCHAGCSGMALTDNPLVQNFTHCACVDYATTGMCKKECGHYRAYVAVTSVKEILASPTQIAIIMATIRESEREK